jgi:hypothetical protein
MHGQHGQRGGADVDDSSRIAEDLIDVRADPRIGSAPQY